MIKSGQAAAGLFVCKDSTGALSTPSVGPAGTLYKNGVADAASVTIAGTNPYKWAVTMPSLAAGDIVTIYITATIASVATAAVVFQDNADTAYLSAIPANTLDSLVTGSHPNGSLAKTVRAIGAQYVTSGTLRSNVAPANGYNIVRLATDAPTTSIDPSAIVFVNGDDALVGQCIEYDGTTKNAVLRRSLKSQVDETWDYFVLANQGSMALNDGLITDGTTTSAALNSFASQEVDAYMNQVIVFTAAPGDTVEDYSRRITSSLYTGGRVWVYWDDPLPAAPTTSTSYEILPIQVYDPAGVTVVTSLAVSAAQASGSSTGSVVITTNYTLRTSITSDVTDNLNSATNIVFAVKRETSDQDSAALLLIDTDTGLRYVNGAAIDPGDVGKGSLTLSGSSGAWTVTVYAAQAITAELEGLTGDYSAELKYFTDGATDDALLAWEGPGEIVTGAIKALV